MENLFTVDIDDLNLIRFIGGISYKKSNKVLQKVIKLPHVKVDFVKIPYRNAFISCIMRNSTFDRFLNIFISQVLLSQG